MSDFHEDGCWHRRRGLCRRCAADYAAYLDELRAQLDAEWDMLLAGEPDEAPAPPADDVELPF
jgi:hypothetical protein